MATISNFASRARRRYGLRAFCVTGSPPLPGPNVFAGLAGCNGCASPCGMGSIPAVVTPTVMPSPSNFGMLAPRARGVGAFRSSVPRPPLPAGNVFIPFLRGLGAFMGRAPRSVFPGVNVFKGLSKFPSRRRGMGDDATDPMLDPDLLPFTTPGWATAGITPTYAPTIDTSDPLLDQGITVSPTPTPISSGGWQVGGDTLPTSTSNPSLDAFNQALTNAQANNPALLNPTTLASLSQAVAAASPASLQQATTALSATPSTTSSILTSLSTLVGSSMGLLLLGGGGILALILITGKKGKR